MRDHCFVSYVFNCEKIMISLASTTVPTTLLVISRETGFRRVKRSSSIQLNCIRYNTYILLFKLIFQTKKKEKKSWSTYHRFLKFKGHG